MRAPSACVLPSIVPRQSRGAAQNLLLDDMLPDFSAPVSVDGGSATWLGVCRPPGSPYVRRLDIKVFPRMCALAQVAACAGEYVLRKN